MKYSDETVLIDKVKQECLEGKRQDRETVISLLEIQSDSDAYDYLLESAREAALQITHGEAYLWGAIGVDYAVCPMNCAFCSLGEAWDLVKEEKKYSQEEIIQQIREYVECGVRFIVLRTTEYYSIDTLREFLESIQKEVPGNYELVLNIGEFDADTADQIYESGASGIYHAVRLREGTDTVFEPEQRIETLKSVMASDLKLIHLVEPLGPEHTNEEIADVFLQSLDYGAVITGVMARTPVEGTPLGNIPMVEQKRLLQVAAVIRLCAGSQAPDVCVHPPSAEAAMAGANVMVVERGAIPRDTELSSEVWNRFDVQTAAEYFQEAGYQVVQKKERL